MTHTAVELCGIALTKLGATPFAEFTAATTEAEVASRLYPAVRDAVLSAHPWGFSLAHAALEAEGTEPLADFRHSFSLPADFLRAVSAGTGGRGRGLVYRIVGPRLLANAPSLILTYQRQAPESDFPAYFAQALITRLAAELCVPITANAGRALELLRLAEAELRLARLLDSQQATPQAVEDFTLVGARGL